MSADLVLHDEPPETHDRILGLASAALSGCTRVRLAWAFGSFVEGRRFRDLDIAVQIYGIPEWHDPADVARAVWDAAGRPDWDVDVVTLNDATPHFRKLVTDSGRLIFERASGEAMEFAGLATTEVIDLLEWRRSLDGPR